MGARLAGTQVVIQSCEGEGGFLATQKTRVASSPTSTHMTWIWNCQRAIGIIVGVVNSTGLGFRLGFRVTNRALGNLAGPVCAWQKYARDVAKEKQPATLKERLLSMAQSRLVDRQRSPAFRQLWGGLHLEVERFNGL
jgi:hypothetical protein